MTTELPHRRYPCAECPWRKDTEPGQFPACNYDALRDTSGEPGREAGLIAPMFACHKSPEGREEACAGWLVAVGRDHIGIRLAVVSGRLPPEALHPEHGWPELFGSYTEMAAIQASDDQSPAGEMPPGDGAA